jgi:cyclic beta-1,2-glucan synthetase
MNVQSDPARLQLAHEPLPAAADDPIRATFLHEDSLRKLGETLALGEAKNIHGPGAFDFQARVRDNASKILAAYREMNDAQARGETVTPAAQWLLDNFYVVEETVFQIKRDIPRRFYKQLPTITLPNGVIVPRALAIAWLYVAHCDSAVSARTFEAIVQGYQSAEPLRIGELWALPSLLRFVLIENLRRLAMRVVRAREMRRIANDLADRLLAADPEVEPTRMLAGFTQHARDTTFATQLLYRLRDGSQHAGRALIWLEDELEKSGSDAEEVILGEHRTLSSGNVTTGNIIRGLRLINDIEWTEWFEGISRVDTLLREQTDFAKLDFPSRDQYRTAIEQLARRSNLSEHDVASRAIEMARLSADGAGMDVGFFLVGPRRQELEKELGYSVPFGKKLLRSFRRTGWTGVVVPVLVMTLLLLTMAGSALLTAGIPAWAVTTLLILFAVPASEGALAFFNTIVLQFMKPTSLVGYEYKEGVPSDARTLVVVPSLISSRDDVEESMRNLEVHYLANMKGDLHFALLSDWPDSDEEQSQADLELLAYARDCVAQLNQRYPERGPRFHLLHRRRLYNESQKCWMGWERKRGKLHELDLLLRGDSDTTFLPPDTPLPEGIVYVMTMDADTRMTRDAVARLVGKLRHPLNRPVLDATSKRVVSGYSILQPRVTPSLTTGDEASFFQRIFSANRGMDPYVFAVSDLYQDVFGEGTFTGKGLYDVDAMEAALQGKIPENAVLSHDLLEGAYARAGLVTDVELVEDYPTRYAVDASRQHRWARGDWQLLPFIFDPTSGVPALSRWKMIDNLRRSLTPIFWILASIAGWTFLPFTMAAQWQALLILSLFMAPTFEIVNSLIPDGRETTVRAHFSSFFYEVAHGSAQVALRVVLMAHSAWMMGDAIIRTLYRVFVTRQNLLEWRTASQAQKNGANTLSSYYGFMGGSVLIALLGLAAPVLADSTGAFVAFIFFVFWAGAPAFAWFISRSAETEDRLHVSRSDRDVLRGIARRTWLFFETFVTEEDNWLPPDNYQEIPYPVVAHRTSPTNIGVYLLSIISARDFGWISLANTIERLDQTLSTLERMERDRGHLYNWYETKTLRPLYPRYISSVDSGNLAGHLVAVAAACNEWAMAPAAYLQGDFDGMLDTVAILQETLDELPDDRRQIRPLRQRLRDRIAGMHRAVRIIRNEPETAAIRTINLAVLSGDIRKLASAIHAETKSKGSEQLLLWATKLEMTCEFHVSDAHTDEKGVEALRARLRDIHDRARLFAFQMDFSFLLRKDRKLLSIGYRVDEHQLDEACYDLLASEARLTSLFAIAKGDVSTEHWLRLGRPVTEIGFRGALLSWSGSMFEYLMPPLVMKEPHGGILNQTNNLIIRKQISYGRSKGVPWGISEAAFNARDREMTYQYTNFGVPGLGLKRGLAQNTVIAPYATVLASQYMPAQAVDNLQRLRAIGALGIYGFHDAVDFTPTRVPEGHTHAVVYNYMAHHQGMSVVAVANVVFEGRMRDRFHSDPVIESAELLLQEKAPRDIPVTFIGTETAEEQAAEVKEEYPDTRVVLNPSHALRATNVLSNGHYSLMTTATGSGYSRLNELAVTRWQADPVEDRSGTYLFLTDTETGEWWSATAEPKRAPGEVAQTLFTDDKSTFIKAVGKLRTEVECIVISEGNGEGRRINIINDGATDRHIDVTSFAEIALAPESSDSGHPAFSKMFVETEIGRQNTTIYASRRKYSPNDPDIALAHFVSGAAILSRETEAETDRRAFIGRGRTIANPAAFDSDGKLGGHQGFVLDPVMALRCRVRVPAGKKISLTFWTIVAANRAELDETIGRLDHAESFQRQAMLAWTRSQVQTRHIGLSLADAANVQKLARYLIYPSPAMRLPGEAIASGLGRQSALWPMAISGDYPIFVLRIGDVADLEIIATTLRMQEYMRARGLFADLVIVNEQAASYVQDLQQAIESLCENSRLRGKELGPRQHIFAVRRDLMDENSYRTLLGVARVVLHTRNGTIFDQIERAETAEIQARQAAPQPTAPQVSTEDQTPPPADIEPDVELPAPDGTGLVRWNGYGGFDNDGRDYVVRLSGDRATPHPWINVIANGNFGFHTSAEGASFTWSRNSRDFQLTPWTNDPVTNRPGEAIYIFDHGDKSVFSPFAAVARDPALVYEARHGQGVSSFSTKRGPLAVELTQVVDPEDPVKVSRLTIRNEGADPVRLRVYAYAEWVLGTNRAKSAPTIIPARDETTGALLARNAYSLDYGERTAFLTSDGDIQSFTADRLEFIGHDGTVQQPEAVMSGSDLSGTVEPGRDPCAALARDVEIQAGEEATMLWLLGDAASPEEAAELILRHRAVDYDRRLVDNRAAWNGFLETLQVDTPDDALNAMVNFWLPYQAVACRIRARTAFYQASGAFGFRDQLQDTLALLLHEPGLARAQILNAAGRQFPEGDVQHWWLPRTGAGVRTTISDDVVWLAYGVHRYISVTGDEAILQEELPFIQGPALEEGEHDAFFTPEVSETTASLYEHCARGLDLAVERTGPSGLPLILGGDWNDGMNRVGAAGRGESVWLGWFLLKALADFIPIARSQKDLARSVRWHKHERTLKRALETAGWDGRWYRRGFYDDGTPLGSKSSDECKIDSIAQSWSVLSGHGDEARSRTALTTAQEMLVDPDLAIAKLFTPAFSKTDKEPGYIKSYPPGVRENGGQYTHAAAWLVIALANNGQADDAYRLLTMLNPVNHALDEEAAERYRVEPYVVAADVYTGEGKEGRGGWTWYTGSAGWLYRSAVEGILGIRREGDQLLVEPALPSEWDGFSATLRLGASICRIQVSRKAGSKDLAVMIDGKKASKIVLDGKKGEKHILVTVPA